jgi:thiol-disulfide isomerase/thioredoxin
MQPLNRPSFSRPESSPAENIDAEFDAATGHSVGGSAIAKYIVLGLLVVVGFVAWRSYGPKPVLAGWSQDWSATAQPTGKPTLVLFTADWCPPCKQFKQELARDDVAAFLQKNYSLVVVDLTDRTSENNSRAAWYGVQAVPTLILFDTEGVERGRNNGMSGDDLLTWLHRGGRF